MKRFALILDLDNTLYSWMDSYAPALDKSIKFLAHSLNLSIPIVRNSYKVLFQKYNSVEVINAACELDIWDNILISTEERESIQRKTQELFLNTFRDNLSLFPNVEKVLTWAKNNGIMIIGFTDARAFWIDFRLRALNLYSYFDRLYVLCDEDSYSNSVNEYPSKICQYSLEHSKPQLDMYIEILRANKLKNSCTFMIGDSKRKDIKPASELGISTIWARYGGQYSSSSKQLLSAVTPWTPSQRASGGRVEPQYIIDDFSEVISIVKLYMEDSK